MIFLRNGEKDKEPVIVTYKNMMNSKIRAVLFMCLGLLFGMSVMYVYKNFIEDKKDQSNPKSEAVHYGSTRDGILQKVTFVRCCREKLSEEINSETGKEGCRKEKNTLKRMSTTIVAEEMQTVSSLPETAMYTLPKTTIKALKNSNSLFEMTE